MSDLKLDFIRRKVAKQHPVVEILDKYGKNISEFAKQNGKDYLTSVVVSGTEAIFGEPTDFVEFSLYVIAPEIDYDYKVLNVDIRNQNKAKIVFFPLNLRQSQIMEVDTSKGYGDLENKVNEILSSDLANDSYAYIIDQVDRAKKLQND